MIKSRMRLAGIRSLKQISHSLLPLSRRSGHSFLKRLIETNSVRQRTRITKCKPHIAEVVDCHSRDNDEDVVLAEAGHCLPETVVLNWVFGVEEGDLDDGDI